MIDRVIDKQFIEVQVVSDLSIAEEVKSEVFECHCASSDENCYEKCLNNDASEFNLMVAGEILLITAIIVSLSVLVTILLKFLTRVRFMRGGNRVNNLPDAFSRNDNRASLTSLQRTVLEKMRDRPPRYETRHNYDYRRREQRDNNENEGTREMGTSNILGFTLPSDPPPPPYNNSDGNSAIDELPPAYTINSSDSSIKIENTLHICEREKFAM